LHSVFWWVFFSSAILSWGESSRSTDEGKAIMGALMVAGIVILAKVFGPLLRAAGLHDE
jgi:hypothetical protein